MRTILNRIGKDMKKPYFEQAEEKPLNFEQATKTTMQEMRALRTDKVASKSANTDAINRNKTSYIPISDVTGSRGLVSQGKKLENDNNMSSKPPKTKEPYIPISVVTGSRDITTVSPELRAYLLKGSPSATNAIPGEYADLANVLNKASDVIDFDNWGDLTAMQQLATAQKAGLSEQDKRTLLNTSSHYVETIAKIQAVFANRYQLGISLTDARNVAKELFDIANEKEEAYTRTGKYEQDAVFAPKALRWLKEKEDKILDNLTKNAGETNLDTEYTGENPLQSTSDDKPGSSKNGSTNGYIQVPGIPIIGPGRSNPPVNCYGYVLMNLGIKPSDGNYDIQPGMLSETSVGDHAHADGGDHALNTDTDSIINYIVRDIEKTGRDVRMIESCDDADEGETLVALKNDNFFFGGDSYHVAIQLPDGTWADKRGIGNESRQGEIDNPDGPWAAEWWKKVYDTPTYYFAISEP